MQTSKPAWWLIIGMFLFACIYNAYLPAHTDAAYYWQWSRHLALSYFDGPPLMAYLIHALTALFGNSAFIIKSAAVICMTIGLSYIYRLAHEMFGVKCANYALLIMLVMPLTQVGFAITTLDPALFCCWALAYYYFYKAITDDKTRYRYLTGLFLGLALLAKYPAILLAGSFFIYLLITGYRKEFKNIHWYLAAILAVLVFSPVITWNWQHHWLGFTFQYNHGVAKQKIFQFSLLLNYLGMQFGVSNPVFFLATLYFLIRRGKSICTNKKLLYLAVPFLGVFLFFLYQSLFKKGLANWPAPAYISASILVAYFIEQFRLKVLLIAIITVGLILSLFVRFPRLTPFLPNQSILKTQFLGYPELVQQATGFYSPGDVLVSDSYQNASELALYLPNYPQTYVLKSDRPSEYTFWSAALVKRIQQGQITHALYIGEPDEVSNSLLFFKHSKLLGTLRYSNKWQKRQWAVIRLWN